MVYVEKVKSSLKGGVDVKLGPRTVLYGANGSGKTSVIQAIELASGGYVSDMEGRDQVKSHTALARLFPPGNRMFAEIALSSGVVCDWEMKPGATPGSFKKPVPNAPVQLRWPVQELSSILGGEGATVKAWLEGEVVGPIAEEDVLGAIPANLHEAVQRLIRSEGKTDFLSLSKAAKAKAKSLRSAATRKEKTIQQMTQGISTPLLASEREAMEAELSSLRASRGMSQEEYDRRMREAQALAEVCKGYKEEHAQLPELDPKVAEAIDKLSTAKRLIRQHQETFGDETGCWTCGSGLTLGDQLASITEALASERLQQPLAHEMRRRELEVAISGAYSKLEQMTSVLQKATVAPDTSDRQSELVKALAEDKSARQAWTNAKAAQFEVSQSRKEATALSEAATELSKAGDALLTRRKSAFESRVTSFLPEGDVVGVDLGSARVGFLRKGNLHSALSGAEWSRVLLALAASSGEGSTPCVLAPSDRSWDRDTLTNVMGALSESSSQIILMSTVRPDPVEGWTLVEL